MRKAAIISAAAHVLVIALVYFGMPSLFRPAPVEDTPVSVEIVSLQEAPTPAPPPKPAPEPEAKPPPKPAPPPKVEAPPPPPAPPPAPEPPAAAAPEPEPIPLPQQKPEPKPRPEPKPEPPPKVAAAPPAPTPKRKPKPPPDEFQALLKNLAQQKAQQQKSEKRAEKKAPAKPPETLDVQSLVASLKAPQRSAIDRQRMGATLAQLVKQQVTPCWAIPGGAKDVADMKIAVRIQLNPDGTLRGPPRIEDTARFNSDGFYRAVAESALRALRNPRCSPLRLPHDQYDLWKDITFIFEPGEALGP